MDKASQNCIWRIEMVGIRTTNDNLRTRWADCGTSGNTITRKNGENQGGSKDNRWLRVKYDPDADRFGIAVKNYDGKFVHINGNQTMVVLTDYLLSKLSKEKAKSFIASTVVSTPMMSKIAKKNSIKIMLSLTGFKWIGKMINDYPELEYICGGEESFGFLAGNHVRDKDAITSALILSELCNELKNKNSSFYDRLIECYINYGFFKEKLITEIAKGKKGAK